VGSSPTARTKPP